MTSESAKTSPIFLLAQFTQPHAHVSPLIPACAFSVSCDPPALRPDFTLLGLHCALIT
jgi:hypothetical protein